MSGVFAIILWALLVVSYVKESNPLKLNRLNAKMNSPVNCNAVENALGFVRKKNAFGKLCTVGVFSPRKAITASTCVNGLDNYHLEVVVMFTNPGSSVYNVTAVYYENPIVILFLNQNIQNRNHNHMLNISNLDKLPVAIGDESLVVGVTAEGEIKPISTIVGKVDGCWIRPKLFIGYGGEKGDLVFIGTQLMGIVITHAVNPVIYRSLSCHIQTLLLEIWS